MTLHRTKLFGGRETAEEVHSKLAFPHDAKCTGCKTRAVMTRILVLCPLDELKKRDPIIEELMVVDPLKFHQLLVQTKHGPHVKLSTVYACRRCTPAAERVAAKAPSWMIVDINRGPSPDRAVSGAGGLS